MANLKQAVVVVNEYTVKDRKTGRGSRGSSPGEYVLRYMARELATETVEPVKRNDTDIAAFVTRYMARENATERAESIPELKEDMREAQGLGGVAFGYGQLSLSHQRLKAASADIQRLFDEGHTVMKTVLSFDQEYLRTHGIIDRDFVCERPGDYRGNIDQLKLRMAIMHGMDRMGSMYDDLRYVAVIQVDTEHVHCHLAMADAGRGRLAKDGTQKGKLDRRAVSMLRRGIDMWLDEKQTVAHLANDVHFEKRNVITYVKRWAHQEMLRESMPQFLLACLPEDRSLWRAGTNRKEMRKPNAIVHQMVEEMFEHPSSPLGPAMATVHAYANQRREAEGLSQAQWRRLVENGRDQITASAVNGVYALLRSLPQDALTVRTPMLDAMSMDYEQMAAKLVDDDVDPMVDFGFKLRSYSSRLDHHTEKRHKFHELVRDWDVANDAGAADPASVALRRLYEEEEEYHAMLMSKYRHFLPFSHEDPDFYQRWGEVADLGERALSLEMLARDDSLRKMKDPAEAEARGLEVYGQHGGALMTTGSDGKQALMARAERLRMSYDRRVGDLRVTMASRGLVLTVTTPMPDPSEMVFSEGAPAHLEAEVEDGTEYDFEQVKGLDLHHLRYDFSSDVQVGQRSVDAFVKRARLRSELLVDAVAYLEDSGQGAAVSTLPGDDIAIMEAMADKIEADPDHILPSELALLAEEMGKERMLRRSRTVQLGLHLADEVDSVVAGRAKATVNQLVPASFRVEQKAQEMGRSEGLG